MRALIAHYETLRYTQDDVPRSYLRFCMDADIPICPSYVKIRFVIHHYNREPLCTRQLYFTYHSSLWESVMRNSMILPSP